MKLKTLLILITVATVVSYLFSFVQQAPQLDRQARQIWMKIVK